MKLKALRDMDYRTRRLKAGDEFDAFSNEDARQLMAVEFAEEVSGEPARVGRPRGRPRKEPKAEEPKLEEKTVPELREMAEEKGVDLPSGYVRKDELVDLVTAADDDDESMT